MSMIPEPDYFDALAESGLSQLEGQLSVDVFESRDFVVIRSAIAGVGAEELDIAITSDTVTIRGAREHGHTHAQDDVLHIQECYWGSFSRSIVLPCHVKPDEADAELRNGILTIRLKKAEMSSHISVLEAG